MSLRPIENDAGMSMIQAGHFISRDILDRGTQDFGVWNKLSTGHILETGYAKVKLTRSNVQHALRDDYFDFMTSFQSLAGKTTVSELLRNIRYSLMRAYHHIYTILQKPGILDTLKSACGISVITQCVDFASVFYSNVPSDQIPSHVINILRSSETIINGRPIIDFMDY